MAAPKSPKRRSPKSRLESGRRGRFGQRWAQSGGLKWRPWEPEDAWEVAHAHVQHLLAVEVNDIIEGNRNPSTTLELGETVAARSKAVADYCEMSLYGLREKLAGRRSISGPELWAWVALAGVDILPAAVIDLLPPREARSPLLNDDSQG